MINMSNKTQLQTNNTSLDNYIVRINAAKETVAELPEASDGESDEFISVTVDTAKGLAAYYIDEQYSVVANNSQQASVVKAYRGVIWTSATAYGKFWEATGNYLADSLNCVYIFKENGGTLTNTGNPYEEQ